MQYVIVGYDDDGLFAVGPFSSREAARKYSLSPIGDKWIGWNITELKKPEDKA